MKSDISQMSSTSILDWFVSSEIVDRSEYKEEVSLIWKQMRLLVTQQPTQNEVRQYFEQSNMHKVFQKVSQIVHSNIFHENGIDSFFFQFMANFITGNAANKQFIIDTLFSDVETYYALFQDIYDASSFKDFKLRKFICMFLYNFLKGLDVELILTRVLNNLSHILKGIFVEFLINETNNNIDLKENSTQISAQNQEIQATYWTLILISLLFNSMNNQKISLFQYFETLLISESGVTIVKEDDGTYIPKCKGDQYSIVELISNSIFEKFQLFLFHISQQFIDEKVNNSFVKDLEPTIIDVRCQYVNKKDYKFQLSIRDFDYICIQFISIHQNLHQELTKRNAYQLVEVEALQIEDKQLLTYHLTQLHDKLRIFCMMTFLGGYNNKLQKQIIEIGLFVDVLNLNQNLQRINSLNFDRSKPLINLTKQCLIYFNPESYQDIFSSIMRLLSNVAHINREAQDYIMNNNYLVSCLNQTHMDATNPLQREWSVMLIRNLCDSNDDMQKAIAELKIYEFNDKTKEVLQKYQAKREELEGIRQSIKDGTLLQDEHIFNNKLDEDDHYNDDESDFYKKD